MFLRVKRVGNYRYLQLVENHRLAGRTAQQVLCRLGRLDRLQSSGCIDALLSSLSRFALGSQPMERDAAGVSAFQNVPKLDPETAHKSYPEAGSSRISDTTQKPASASALSDAQEGSGEQECLSQAGKIGILRECKLFSDLDRDRLAELSGLATQRALKRGHFLFFQDDPVDSLYVVVSGVLKASRVSPSGKEVVGTIYRRGDPVSIVMLFVDETHQASCQAIRESCVLEIRKDDLLSFLKRDTEAGIEVLIRMLSIGGRRFRSASGLFFDLATESTDYRLSRTIAALYAEYGGMIPLTRREIAELAGTTPETTTRFVSRLRQRGVLRSMRGRLMVIEPRGLGLLPPNAIARTGGPGPC